jgi:lysophospholipase L1-like esterase
MRRCRSIIFSLLIALALSGLQSCSAGTKLPRLSGDSVILAFGDSLTFGTGAEPGDSYPAVLSKLIGRRVVNAGVPGEVTAEGLSRLPRLLEETRPALLILCHGGNDLLRRLEQPQAAGNLRAMIRLAQEGRISVVMIAVPSPGLSLSPPSYYRELAAEMKIPVEEKALAAILSDRSLKADYIHPNAAGYRMLAEAIAALLKKSGAVE